MDWIKAVSSPQTKHSEVKIEIAGKNAIPQKPCLLGLGNGLLDPFDRQGVFGADVDNPRGGSDGVSGDDQSFESLVGVAFEKGPVHEGPRVSLIGIQDYIFGLTFRLGNDLPFLPRRITGPPSAA